MKTWHRHLVLWGKAKREGRLARRRAAPLHEHRWGAYDQLTCEYFCSCGAKAPADVLLATERGWSIDGLTFRPYKK